MLNEYAKLNKIDNKKWHLLTGNKKALYDIARKGYFSLRVEENIQDAFIILKILFWSIIFNG